MRYLLSFIIFLCVLCLYTSAEVLSADTLQNQVDVYDSKINYDVDGQVFIFTPDIRPLVPIPGGRKAFYTYLWDFGDGNFSTEESPQHVYDKPGEYEVKLYATNNYDNGPPPKRPKRKVAVSSALAANKKVPNSFEERFFNSNGIFQLYKNSDALPGEDMAIVVGVKPQSTKGKIIILTNEKEINPNGFEFAHQSIYNNEQIDSSSLFSKDKLSSMWAQVQKVTKTQSGSPDYGNKEEYIFNEKEAVSYFSELFSAYKSVTAYDIESEDQDSQFSIIDLNVTPEMLADTNAVVTITGIYLPEEGMATVHQLDVPVVTSHDPNKMTLKQSRLSYRMQYKKKKLTYKVQFQNDGEGDAKNIRLEIKLPKEVNTETFELLNLYPQCDTCQTDMDKGCYTIEWKDNNVVEFVFKDIALPGTAAPDITDMDSTKGFIRFNVQTHKKLQNKPLKAHTNIYFDKNEPIRTNNSYARFIPGLSPLILAGLNSPLQGDDGVSNRKGYAFSIGLAPIAPYKKIYWQVELSTFSHGYSDQTFFDKRAEMEVINEEGKSEYKVYDGRDSIYKSRNLRLNIPVQLRYNFNRWISAGAGAIIGTDINLSTTNQDIYHIIEWTGEKNQYIIESKDTKKTFSPLRYAPFVDINIGRTYMGPALGLRYLYDSGIKHNGQIYLIWRL